MLLEPLLAKLEQNIADDHNMQRLAQAGLLSRSQLYRELYSVIGHTMGEYIRRRRLSNALALIKTSQFSLADIACRCGFSSQSALNRAVRQTVGMTPSAYKTGEAYYFFPPFAGQALFPVSVKPEHIPATQCLRYYDPKYIGIEDRALEWLFAQRPGYNGRVFGRSGKQLGAESCYELYIESDQADHPVISALFATTTAPNEEAKINAAWDYLYLAWLAGSMFERTEQPYFEEYIMKNGRPVKLRLFLPIQRRADCANITLEQNPALHFVVASAKTEKAAARDVMANYPQAAQHAREFYVQHNAHGCTCGVRVGEPNEEHTLTLPPGHYLVLHSPVMGDYHALCERLLAFAAGNNMAAQREDCFAVYDAHAGFKNLGMKLYCSVKLSQNNENLELCEKTTPRQM
ncbi:MAG: helix-turn-helix domain-containing protein [Oscillospiraceae bacterium]|nr:helix-turn-helix domain-containing protein [Oscillospiraceae bacterium]